MIVGMETNPYDVTDGTGLAPAIMRAGEVYRIFCGKCWIEARKTRQGIDLARAAAKFFRDGWRLDSGVTVCPKCSK